MTLYTRSELVCLANGSMEVAVNEDVHAHVRELATLALEALELRALVPSDDVLARIDYRTDAETDEWLDRVRAYREGR
jgi:hypothetical protein